MPMLTRGDEGPRQEPFGRASDFVYLKSPEGVEPCSPCLRLPVRALESREAWLLENRPGCRSSICRLAVPGPKVRKRCFQCALRAVLSTTRLQPSGRTCCIAAGESNRVCPGSSVFLLLPAFDPVSKMIFP